MKKINCEHLLNEIGETYAPLSTACQQDFIAYSKITTFKKGEVVVREGQFSKTAYLMIEGCARAYYLIDY